LPQEAFNKVTADMLTEQIKAMGNSGVGRVLMAEVNNMKKSLAGLGITATTNRALAEIVSRNYDKMQKIAEIANGVPQVPGQMNRELDKRVQAYLAKNPLFTPQELAHPALLGAPDAPPGAEKWNQAQGRAWGAKIGLKPGDPVRINGVIRNLQ
jgi:predicted TIM-barrel fold metal-dependent hydrolase